MSENLDLVRQTLRGGPDRSFRLPEEWAASKAPALTRAALDRILRLSPDSVARRRLLAVGMERLHAGINRGEYELFDIFYAEDATLAFPAGAPPLGAVGFQGRASIRAAYEGWREPWRKYRRLPCELIDMGERLVVLAEESGTGVTSGVEVRQRVASVLILSKGWIVRQDEYPSWETALRAVGLDD
jgi:ketosteroid isomerase-like protein